MIDEFLKQCPNHISTAEMTNGEWLAKRREGIGGSDAGAIMGLSNYGSPLTVYLQKKGLIENKKESVAARRGTILEPYIRQIAREEYPNLQIEEVPYMFFSEENPFMLANIDGLIWAGASLEINDKTVIDGWGGFEAKSSKTGYGFGDDEVPDSYYAQVQHYMEVLHLKWFLLSVYILETEEVKHYFIMRNQEFIDKMISQEKDFWENNYLKEVIPAAVGLESEEDMITGMFEGSEPLVLDDTLRDFCGEYVSINRQIKELEEKKQAVKVNLMEGIVQNVKGKPTERKVSALAGPYSVSWITVERRDVDRDALKKAGLYDQYVKVSCYDRFTVTEKKAG